MRRVVASEFVSLDGVMESPEKWHFPYFDDEMGQEIRTAVGQTDAMLMGRVIDFWVAFSEVVIIVRRLIRESWSRHRWETRPPHRP